MKTKRKIMVVALLVLAVLSVGITPIFAAPDICARAGEASGDEFSIEYYGSGRFNY